MTATTTTPAHSDYDITDQVFVLNWEVATNLGEFCRRVCLDPAEARARERHYRDAGIDLKPMRETE